MAQTAAAGWYPDPNDPQQLRYWDGQRWTEHRAPRGGAPAPEEPKARRVPLFGARSVARDLASENEELRRALSRVGALDVFDAERELADARQHLAAVTVEAAQVQAQLAAQKQAVEREIADLRRQVLDLRQAIDVQEFGLYDFEHPAESSATLADELAALRLQIKHGVSSGAAVTATNSFTFNNSAAKGQQFIKGMSRTMLAAYNAEAENCIKTVRAGGLSTAHARLDRVVAQVERNGQMIDLRIAPAYHQLRLHELSLAARHEEALKAEREAERERRAALREQARVEEELRRERERLQKEREHWRASCCCFSRAMSAGTTPSMAFSAHL